MELAQARPKNIRSIEIVPEQNRMLLYLCRAVATGLVSPVSTGPLFPSLVAYLVLPIIAPLLGGCPRNAPKHIGTMLKVVKWLRTMRQNCSASLPSNNFPFLQGNASLASCTCKGCGFRPISKLERKADTTGVRRKLWEEWHSCETLSFGL